MTFFHKQEEENQMPVGAAALRHAWKTLTDFHAAKREDDRRVSENEAIFRLSKGESVDATGNPKPTGAWLFNCIVSKHADTMEAYPTPTVLPREKNDEAEADKLTKLIPVILERCDFEKTFSDVSLAKLKSGTGVYGVFWDARENGGLGDICIRDIDVRRLFWEPGIRDIEDSSDIFYVRSEIKTVIEEQYGQTRPKLFNVPQITDVFFDVNDDRTVVVDWYYKKKNGTKTVLHYAQFTTDRILYATENDEATREKGLYDHAQYPFVFDVLFPQDDKPNGFGYIDVGKNAQEYIDKSNEAILQNLLVNAYPRHFLREDGVVSEKEFADTTRPFIHVQGSLGEDAIRPVQTSPLDPVYVTILNAKINELKETTGNRDTSNGGTLNGVTAAAAIAAMQEAGSKLSRNATKATYRAFRKICLLIIELIRQFYDLPREYRILGKDGVKDYFSYSNEMLSGSLTCPIFDVKVVSDKSSPYSKLAQNELALNLFNAGMFDPARANEAVICLEMMDFDRKDEILRRIRDNEPGNAEKEPSRQPVTPDRITQVRERTAMLSEVV